MLKSKKIYEFLTVPSKWEQFQECDTSLVNNTNNNINHS